MALMCAIAILLSFIEFPIIPAASFLKLDISFVPSAVMGFAYGTGPGVLVGIVCAVAHGIITGNWVKTRLLVNRLSDYFERYQRPYLRIQLYMLEALIDRRTGKATWKEKLTGALDLARRYKLVRVIADEGIAVLDMLTESKLPEGLWEQGVLALTRTQAAACPGYMRSIARRPTLSDREYQVYSLIISGLSNAKIAQLLNITVRAVKYHVTEIFRKMDVTTRSELMKKAYELGDLQ
jgi:DNA-binding CsgD family transcriptional regulator